MNKKLNTFIKLNKLKLMESKFARIAAVLTFYGGGLALFWYNYID